MKQQEVWNKTVSTGGFIHNNAHCSVSFDNLVSDGELYLHMTSDRVAGKLRSFSMQILRYNKMDLLMTMQRNTIESHYSSSTKNMSRHFVTLFCIHSFIY
jgi:hypothetical protein